MTTLRVFSLSSAFFAGGAAATDEAILFIAMALLAVAISAYADVHMEGR